MKKKKKNLGGEVGLALVGGPLPLELADTIQSSWARCL